MDTDDLDPPRPVLQPLNLQAMSKEDLRSYIAALHAEIERAERMIESKNTLLKDAHSLFGG